MCGGNTGIRREATIRSRCCCSMKIFNCTKGVRAGECIQPPPTRFHAAARTAWKRSKSINPTVERHRYFRMLLHENRKSSLRKVGGWVAGRGSTFSTRQLSPQTLPPKSKAAWKRSKSNKPQEKEEEAILSITAQKHPFPQPRSGARSLPPHGRTKNNKKL